MNHFGDDAIEHLLDALSVNQVMKTVFQFTYNFCWFFSGADTSHTGSWFHWT